MDRHTHTHRDILTPWAPVGAKKWEFSHLGSGPPPLSQKCDSSVSPSPFGLDFGTLVFGTLVFGTWDLGLTKMFLNYVTLRSYLYLFFSSGLFSRTPKLIRSHEDYIFREVWLNILTKHLTHSLFQYESLVRNSTKRASWDFYAMIKCGTGCNPLVYKGYGCYCGFLGSGNTVDPIDT